MLNELSIQWTLPCSVKVLFLFNSRSFISMKAKMLWRVIVPALSWSLWLENNRRGFEDKVEPLEEVCNMVKFRVVIAYMGLK